MYDCLRRFSTHRVRGAKQFRTTTTESSRFCINTNTTTHSLSCETNRIHKVSGDYQTFCENFELFWESLGGAFTADDRQKLHVFKNCLDTTNAQTCASRMLSSSGERDFSYQKIRGELDRKYELRMTDREARKNWESIRLRFDNRFILNHWEAFCVHFLEAQRHVRKLENGKEENCCWHNYRRI